MQIYIYMGVSVYWPLSVLCVFVGVCVCVLCVCDIKSEYQLKTKVCVRPQYKTHIKVVTYPEFFWADQYIHRILKAPPWLVQSEFIFKSVHLNALKMHSLALSALSFLCKTLSKLLKFTLQNILPCG